MKNLLKLSLVSATALTLSACADGLGDFDTAPPYATERTATHDNAVKPAPAPEPAPAPAMEKAPMCKPCEDCGPLKSRISTLESELAACREASNRVRDAYQEELKK